MDNQLKLTEMIWDLPGVPCVQLPLIPPPSRREAKGLHYILVFLSRLDHCTVFFNHCDESKVE